MRRPRRSSPAQQPFRARRHAFDFEHSIDGPDSFLMCAFPHQEGADRLAALLNDAVALAAEPALVTSGSPADARARIAFAIVKALGGSLDYEAIRSFGDSHMVAA